jgi:hypothetical protein
MKRPYFAEVIIQNSSDRDVVFFLEPWGSEHKVTPAQEAVVSGSSAQPGSFTIEFRGDRMVVWGWQQSLADVRLRPKNG